MLKLHQLFFYRYLHEDFCDMPIDEIIEIINNKSNLIISQCELEKLLKSGKKLTIKFGIDPTSSNIHLGHIVPITLINIFVKLGHDVQFVIGDFTAKIGDPSGRTTERKALSEDEIKKNFQSYEEQISKFIDVSKLSIRYNSEWLNQMNSKKIFDLLQKINLSQALQRDDFRKRISNNSAISLAEVCYATLMGIDSIVLKTDIEIGGIDQLLNFQQCRILMKNFNVNPEVAIMTEILEGTSGDGKKMSKSLNNYISINESLESKFAKIMSIRDEQILSYFINLAYIKNDELNLLKRFIKATPLEAKKSLATYIIGIECKDMNIANKIRNDFERKFSKKEIRTEDCICVPAKTGETLFDALYRTGQFPSKSELRRLFMAGAVKEAQFTKSKYTIDYIITPQELDKLTLKVGKKRFFHISVK